MMYILPARDLVMFPGMVYPIFVGRPKTLKAIELASAENKKIFVTAQKDMNVEDPMPDDIYDVGTVCNIVQMLRIPDGTCKILVEGVERMRARTIFVKDDVLHADLMAMTSGYKDDSANEALRRAVMKAYEDYVTVHPKLPQELIISAATAKNAGDMADVIASNIVIDIDKKQNLLECVNVATRLELLLRYLTEEVELLTLEQGIQEKIHFELEKGQKAYYLREQLKVIQKELSNLGEASDTDDLRLKMERLDLPQYVVEKATVEIDRMEKMSPMSPEASVARTYVEWLLDMPWKVAAEGNLDAVYAKEVLDSNHFGLEKVKDRLLEYISVRQMAGSDAKSQIICFVGPPGVGKTSLGKSVADALGRPFVSFSLGGMRDEAEIRGHRRTYIGAMPGRILQKIKQAGCNNPVMLLDEIDKVGADYRGDPSSALLEALDPEQNCNFTDHYLEIPFDLSDVIFITSANVVHTIPKPLLDRMELIELPGYVHQEKLSIAKEHLIPKLYKQHGFKKGQFGINAKAIEKVISDYTHEAGVRDLNRKLETIFRKAVRAYMEKSYELSKGDPETLEPIRKISVTASNLSQYLGAPRIHGPRLPRVGEYGASVGLAWTGAGGDVLVIEAVITPGKGGITLTGNLGSIMQESAKTALGYLKSAWSKMGDKSADWGNIDIHLHVPDGAIPKDGPSAGITMAVAILSALYKLPYRSNFAMTGEISLRGKVLPIGGLREKALAAKRNGIRDIMIPQDNKSDLEDLEPWIKEGLNFTLHSSAETVIKTVLEGVVEGDE